MRRFLFFGFILSIFCLASCVTRRQSTVYQFKDELGDPLPKMDTVVRTYKTTYEPYKLQFGDELAISISSVTPSAINPFSTADPSLSAEGGEGGGYGYMVDSKGMISLPTLGSFTAVGKTLEHFQKELQDSMKAFVRDPIVRLAIVNFKVSVVSAASAKYIESKNGILTLSDLLVLYSPADPYIDWQRVKIIRSFGNKADIAYVNARSETTLQSPYYFLKPNDVVVLPTLKIKTFNTYGLKNIGLVSSLISIVSLAYIFTK